MNCLRLGSVALCAALVACQSMPDLQTVCPAAPKTYTLAQEQKAAAELRSLSIDSELNAMIADYAAQRAAAKACRQPQL